MSNKTLADKEFKARVTEIIEENISDENFSVQSLSEKLGMSRSSLHRKINSIAHISASQFIRNVRLEKAKELLRQSSYSVSEIAYKIGFSHPSYFTKCFRDYTGVTPVQYAEADIKEVEQASPDTSGTSPRLSFRNKWVTIGALAIFTILIIIVVNLIPALQLKGVKSIVGHNPKGEVKSIAVLPFSNLNKLEEDLYFTEGVTESVIDKLIRIKNFRVVAIDPIEQISSGPYNMQTISKKFNVNYILTGSVQRMDNRVMVMIQLTDAREGELIWSETYDRKFSDFFEIQSEIAKQVASSLSIMISPVERKLIEKVPTENDQAHAYYLQARYFLNNRSFEKSMQNFQNAVDTDPLYAMAWTGLADAYLLATLYQQYPRPQGYAIAKKMARKALQLDEDLAEAHASLGAILCYGDWNWEEARNEFKKALQLNPNSATAHYFYAKLLSALTDFDGAREHIDQALILNPTAIQYRTASISTFCKSFKPEQALTACIEARDLFPNHYSLSWHFFHVYVMLDEQEKALAELEKALNFHPEDHRYAELIQTVYAQSGMTGVYEMLIDYESEDFDMGVIGMARDYARLGDNKKAIECLEKAFDMRVPFLPNSLGLQDFKDLLDEPGFQFLLEKLGLSNYYLNKTANN